MKERRYVVYISTDNMLPLATSENTDITAMKNTSIINECGNLHMIDIPQVRIQEDKGLLFTDKGLLFPG